MFWNIGIDRSKFFIFFLTFLLIFTQINFYIDISTFLFILY